MEVQQLICLQTFVLMELTTQTFQSHKGDARTARKIPDTCAVNETFVCIVIRVLCVLVCITLIYDLKLQSCKLKKH